MAPKAILGRGRNKLKYCKWGCYFKGDGRRAQLSMKSSRATATTQKARVLGGPNQSLVVEKVSKNKVEVAWPLPVSADSCCLLLKRALGGSWRNFVTDPAGVQGAHQEAATAEKERWKQIPPGKILEDLLEAALFDESSTSRGASSSAAGPVSPRPRVWERSSRALQQPRPAVVSFCSQ